MPKELFAAKTPEETAKAYNDWAAHYEQEIENTGYCVPLQAALGLAKYITDKDAKILDAGCGTGLAGKMLYDMGYRNIYGIDIAENMLAEAAKKHCHIELRQQALGVPPLAYPAQHFDAVMGAGLFAYGHAPHSALEDLAHLTRRGGYVIFTVRPEYYENTDFKDKIAALDQSGIWQLVELSEPFQVFPKTQPDFYMRVWVYQIL